jgi:hypothetical protein
MRWWSTLLARLRRTGSGAAALTPQERALIGEPVEIVATQRTLPSAFGPVTVPFVVRCAGRTRYVWRVPAEPDAASVTELLGQIARLHSALDEPDVLLLSAGQPLPLLLWAYARLGRLERLELLCWLAAEHGDPQPLRAALARVFGIELHESCASVGEAVLAVASERGGAAPRRLAPAAAVERALAETLGRALAGELGGELLPEGPRWMLPAGDGRLELDLGRWIELAMAGADAWAGELPEDLRRHLADPAYLLDPVSFASGRWLPEPEHAPLGEALEAALCAFAEMRAEAVVRHGAELLDSGDTLLECPGCSKLSGTVTGYPGAESASLQSLLLALYQHVHALELSCAHCAASLSSRDFRVARAFRLLPERGADVALQLSRAEDGHVVARVRVFAPGGRVLERAGTDERAVLELAGRYLSARSAWLELLQQSHQSRQRAFADLDSCGTALVVPGGPGPASERLAAAAAALGSTGERTVLRLGGRGAGGAGFLDGAYREWAGDFEPLLLDGQLLAALLLDFGRVEARFVEAAASAGASVRTEAGVCTVRRGPYRVDVPLRQRMIEAAHAARYPEERALQLAAEAVSQLRKLGAFVERIRKVCGPGRDYRYEADSGTLHVLLPGSAEGSSFNVPSLLLKFAGDEDELESMIRAMTREEELSLERCRCGAPAYVSLKMKPPGWAGEGAASEVVCEPRNGVLFAYSVDCAEHSGYINRDSMARLGLGLEDLRARFHRDLDHNDYQVGLIALSDGAHQAVGIVGTNAASVACHPALVRRALEIARAELGASVRLVARSTDALLVVQPEAAESFVSEAAGRLDYVLSQSLGLSAGALHFDERVELPPTGRGRLKEVFRMSVP